MRQLRNRVKNLENLLNPSMVEVPSKIQQLNKELVEGLRFRESQKKWSIPQLEAALNEIKATPVSEFNVEEDIPECKKNLPHPDYSEVIKASEIERLENLIRIKKQEETKL